MAEKLERITINGTGFIFDPETGVSYTTNSSGIEIMKKLKEGAGPDEIKKMLVSEFDVKPLDAERDIIDFLEVLKTKGFI